jgi:hypothetical protein
VPGAVLMLIAMFVIGPILLFLAGAVWSAVFGWLHVVDAEQRADSTEAAASA